VPKAKQFSLEIQGFGKNLSRKQAITIVKKIVFDLHSAVVYDTPVLTGAARGNWYPTINARSTAGDTAVTDKDGGSTVSRTAGILSAFKLGQTIWLTNNLPYILGLENGTSAKAPNGMVEHNVLAAAARYGGKVSKR